MFERLKEWLKKKRETQKTVSNGLTEGKTMVERLGSGTSLELESNYHLINEAFGWTKGTVRAMLTLLLVFTLCLTTILKYSLPNIFYLIIILVIASYFYTKIKISR